MEKTVQDLKEDFRRRGNEILDEIATEKGTTREVIVRNAMKGLSIKDKSDEKK